MSDEPKESHSATTHDAITAVTIVVMSLLPALQLEKSMNGEALLKLLDEVTAESEDSALTPAAARLINKMLVPLRVTVESQRGASEKSKGEKQE
ncbi:hypothetical protein ACOTEO_29085 [Achromobacter xylosoxidans]|uniref:hypothetical protein n=1 Tax=Alcaligenes xylosoxydans xylosoxydans TaxID=85698 RepID=UPI00131DBEB0|nr:hypothetical protein [Achromobacter xylosoxidans]